MATKFVAFTSLGRRALPNQWDVIALSLIVGLFVLIVHGSRGMVVPLPPADASAISLSYADLPYYALRTTLRMFLALGASLVFTFVYATLAAKSRRAEAVLIPLLDVLQSVPILGFLTFTVTFFLGLFPGSTLGAELACIFAIFTSQAWNMAFSFYQSLRTVPSDLEEVSEGFRLSSWQIFWQLETPFAMPGLIYNTMMSMSGGWFFVVAAEAVSVGDTTWKLPGIGSYVALALEQRDLAAVGWAILAMLCVILLYDQLLFRPLVAWSAKFRFETAPGGMDAEDPWMLKLLRRTRVLRRAGDAVGEALGWFGGRQFRAASRVPSLPRLPGRAGDGVFYAVLIALAAFGAWEGWRAIAGSLTLADVAEAFKLGAFTLIRVVVLMILATLVWVPIGVLLGLNPVAARRAQPIAQFLAAFPANLFFPVFVVAIVRWKLNPDIWLTPLMVLGTQWYILFNVVAGAAAFPGDLREAARNFRVGGWLWWRRVILPGIFSYYVTGAITASGGSWNAAIVAEVASWGQTKLVAHGLGAYIAQATGAGDTAKIVLGVAVMALFVVSFNRLLWRPLYEYANRRLTFG